MTDDGPNMTDEAASALDPAGLWLTITELAEAKGLGKAAVSERVSRFEEQGLLETRPGKGKTKLVNLAAYDRLIGQVTDLAREQGAATRKGGGDELPESNSAAYTRETARRAAYQAELMRLELEERTGKLVKVADLRPIVEASAAAAVAAIERLPQEADELLAIAARGDVAELERALKAIATRMRSEIAAAIEAAVPGGSQEGGAKAA